MSRMVVVAGIAMGLLICPSAMADDDDGPGSVSTERSDPRFKCTTQIFPEVSRNGRTWKRKKEDPVMEADMQVGQNDANGEMPGGFSFTMHNSRGGGDTNGDWTSAYTVTAASGAQIFNNTSASGQCTRGSNTDRPANSDLVYSVTASTNQDKKVKWCFLVDYETTFDELDSHGKPTGETFRDRVKNGVEISCTQFANPNRQAERDRERQATVRPADSHKAPADAESGE